MCRASASPSKSHSGNGLTTAKKDMVASSSRSSSKIRGSKPAFEGANFDKHGNCLKHSAVQLAEQVQQDGRVLWKEVKMVREFATPEIAPLYILYIFQLQYQFNIHCILRVLYFIALSILRGRNS